MDLVKAVARGRLFTRLTVKVFAPDNRSFLARKYVADKGLLLNDHDLLVNIGAALETQFPRHEYDVVPVNGGYNFVCRGARC